LERVPSDAEGSKKIGKVWREPVGPGCPAMAGLGTTGLWQPEAMIEILGAAVVPDERLVRPSFA
jgi:hypothetical protein